MTHEYHLYLASCETKAAAFDTLISDIRNGVVKIVPCDVTKTDNQYGSMDGWLGDNYRNACGNVKIYILASPIYEPIKQFLGDEK